MNEVQFWHWIATGALGVLVMLLSWWGKTLSDDVRKRLTREEFKVYLDEATRSRHELRDSILKLFERAESHEKSDVERFERLTKDFNGGLTSMRDLMYTSKLEILRELNDKVDK